jgi:hypothetical protein
MRRTRDTGPGVVRPGRKLGSWLAICLLLLQLVAVAGHFHPEDFAALQGKATGTVALTATGQGGVPLPAGGRPSLPAHDDCPLCFNLHVLGASALPAPTTLAAPSEHTASVSIPMGELALVSAPHLLFQTRAPPAL